MAALPVFHALFHFVPQSIKPGRCLSCARLRVATGCGAVMPFAGKRQKSRHPLVASNSQSPYIRNPEPATGWLHSLTESAEGK